MTWLDNSYIPYDLAFSLYFDFDRAITRR